jgi:hypothetical protein
MLVTKKCQECGMLVDEGDLRSHADVSHNTYYMTSREEDLLYDSLP